MPPSYLGRDLLDEAHAEDMRQQTAAATAQLQQPDPTPPPTPAVDFEGLKNRLLSAWTDTPSTTSQPDVTAPTTQPEASSGGMFDLPAHARSLLAQWTTPTPPKDTSSVESTPSGSAVSSAPAGVGAPAGAPIQGRQPSLTTGPTPRAMPTGQATTDATLPDHLDTSSRDANLSQWAPALRAVEQRTGLRADALAAIIQAENGGGQSPLSATSNNYFSISAVDSPYQIGAEDATPGYGLPGRFGRYKTPTDSLNHFIDLVSTSPRYAEAWANRGDPQKFFAGLVKGGYIVPEPGFPVETWLQNLDAGRQHFNSLAPQPAPSGAATAQPVAMPQGQQPVASAQGGGLDADGIVKAYSGTSYTYGGPGGRTAGFGAPTDCLVAGTMIETLRGPVPIESVMPGDYALTRAGYRPIIGAWLVGERSVYRVPLSDGREIVGTGNHRVWTQSGWKELQTLTISDTLLPCKKKSSSSMGSGIAAIPTLPVQPLGTTTSGSRGETIPTHRSTVRSGVRSTVRSQRTTRSTTSTTTRSTMHPRTSRVFLAPGIEPNRPMRGLIVSERAVTAAHHSPRRAVHGTPPTDGFVLCVASRSGAERPDWIAASLSVLSVANAASRSTSESNATAATDVQESRGRAFASQSASPALFASALSRHSCPSGRNTAAPPARRSGRSVSGLPERVGMALAYDLEVDGPPEFFANGVLVHNCSGFVAAIYQNQYGLNLIPHTDGAYNQLKGLGAAEVKTSDARPGDVVFYMGAGTGGAITHHMGVYAGDGKVLDDSVSGQDGVHVRDVGHAGQYVILRDPRLNQQTPQSATAPPPIQPTGIAEQTGGAKVNQQQLAQAATSAPTQGGPPSAQTSPSTATAQTSPVQSAATATSTTASPDLMMRQPLSQTSARFVPDTGRPPTSGFPDPEASANPPTPPSPEGYANPNLRYPLDDAPPDQGPPWEQQPAPGPAPRFPQLDVAPDAMYRQPLSATAGPDTFPTDASAPVSGASAAPAPGAYPTTGAGAFQDDQTQNGYNQPGVSPSGGVPTASGETQPLTVQPPPRPQTIPNEDQTSYPPAPQPSGGLGIVDTSGPEQGPQQPAESPLKPVYDMLGNIKGYVHTGLEAGGGATNAARVGLEAASAIAPALAPSSMFHGDTGQALLTASDEMNADTKQMLERQRAILDQADAWETANGTPDRTFGVKAVTDPAWRQANPDLAAEWDEIDHKMAIAAGQSSAPMEVARAAVPALQAAQPAVSRVAGAVRGGLTRAGEALDQNAARVAAADVERAGQAGVVAPSAFGAGPIEQGASDTSRFYHGTASDFERANADKFDPNGLYGPGYYTTSDPRVAGSYAEARAPVVYQEIKGPDAKALFEQAADALTKEVPAGATASDARSAASVLRGQALTLPEGRSFLNSEVAGQIEDKVRAAAYEPRPLLDALKPMLDDLRPQKEGQVVRPLDVPNDLSMFDLDRKFTNAEGDFIANQMRGERPSLVTDVQADTFREALPPTPTGSDIYSALSRAFGNDKTAVNEWLSARGFDGVAHTGGGIRPMLDAAGQPIQHEVRVIFPDALSRIRQAYSGEYGGAALGAGATLPGAAPGVSGGTGALGAVNRAIGQGVRAGASGAIGAGIAQEAGDPNDPNRAWKGFAVGAAVPTLGNVVGARLARAAGREIPQAEGALATLGASPKPKITPSAADLAEAQRVGASRGARLNQEVAGPESSIPRAVRAAQAITDDKAAQRYAEDILTTEAGRGKLPEYSQERPSLVSRRNPDSMSEELLANDLEGPLTQVAKQGLQHEVPQALQDIHEKDVLEEFYRRGHQEAIDAGETKAQAQIDSVDKVVKGRLEQAEKRATVLEKNGKQTQADTVRRIAQNNASKTTTRAQDVADKIRTTAEAGAEQAGLARMNKRVADPNLSYPKVLARIQTQGERIDAMAPEAQQVFRDALTAHWKHNQKVLRMAADAGGAGGMTPDLADALIEKYPHYVPTVPLEKLSPDLERAFGGVGQGVGRGGNSMGAPMQKMAKQFSDVASGSERLNPIVATRNATIVRMRQIVRNENFNAFAQMVEDAQAAGSAQGAGSKNLNRLAGDVEVHGYRNGEPSTMRFTRPVAEAIDQAGDMGLSGNAFARNWMAAKNWFTSTITGRRGGFLPKNMIRDFGDMTMITSGHEGGPQTLPKITAQYVENLAHGVGDIGRGLAKRPIETAVGGVGGGAFGAVTGPDDQTPQERAGRALGFGLAGALLTGGRNIQPTGLGREYLARGGGMGTLSPSVRSGERWLRDINANGGAVVQSPKDLARYLADWGWDTMTLKAMQRINDIGELPPRVTAMQLAEKRGATPTESMVYGRDASMDFLRGGQVAKQINKFIPFFNASIQGKAQLARAFRDHPFAATATFAATVVPLVAAVEAYNRMDPQRAQDYADVPDYEKKTGIVMMLPWAGSDLRGNRPNHLYIPVGNYAPLLQPLRDALAKVPGLEDAPPPPGEEPTGDSGTDARTKAMHFFGEAMDALNPLSGDTPTAILSGALPPIAKQAIEIGTNQNLFTGGAVASNARDESASAIATGAAGVINEAGRATGNLGMQNVRPGHAEYILNQVPAFGDWLRGASDAVAPSPAKQAEDRPIQNAPFVGGAVSGIIRDTGGENLRRSEASSVTPELQQVIADAGIRPNQVDTTVGSVYRQAPLTRDEQLRWQDAANRAIDEQVAKVRDSSKWDDPSNRQQLITDAITKAKEQAARDALSDLTQVEIRDRIERQQSMQQRAS